MSDLDTNISGNRKVVTGQRAGGIRAAICCVTYKREQTLAALFNSFAKLVIPAGVEPVFVIVDNDKALSARESVLTFQKSQTSARTIYASEAEKGIPFARNKAIDIAMQEKVDVMLFVDDDETVSEEWLSRIIARYRETDLMLIGAPVKAAFNHLPESYWRKLLQDGIGQAYDRKAAAARRRVGNGTQKNITIITNNWLADTQLFSRNKLRFDGRFRFTGGSDTQYFRDVRALGLRTGWAPEATVFETLSKDRVSMRYLFFRAMSQSRSSVGWKIQEMGRLRLLPVIAALLLLRLFGSFLLVLLIPIKPGLAIVSLIRFAGWSVGIVTGFFGVKSTLYALPDGR